MLQIKQIYYNEETRKRCFESPLVVPHFNEKCSEFFENDVIVNETPQAGYFGVLSWAFIDKVRPLPNRSTITPEYIKDKLKADVLSFFSKNKNRNVFELCNRYHPGSDIVFDRICKRVGYDSELLKENTRFTVYQNAFIAKADIFNQYKDELLKPAMKLMKADPEVRNIVWRDSGYYKKSEMSDKLKRELGVPYYPYHTFICERLLSLFLQKHKHISAIHLI